MSDFETGCCPRFDPAPWEDKIIEWEGKPFVRDTVRCLFHIPLNFGGVMVRNMTAIEAANVKDPQVIVLSGECCYGNLLFIYLSPQNCRAQTM